VKKCAGFRRIPAPRLSYNSAMLLGDNFSTGFFCADQRNVQRSGITVVLDCGAVGLSAIAAAQYLGAPCVLAVDGVESRRNRAAEFGALVATPDQAAQHVQELHPIASKFFIPLSPSPCQ